MLGLLCFAQQAAAICFIDDVECIAGWYLEDYSQDTKSSKYVREWTSHSGWVYVADNVIIARLRFDDEAIGIFRSNDAFGLEVEAVLKGENRNIGFDRYLSTFPSGAKVGYDTNVLDFATNESNTTVRAVHVLKPQVLEANTDYYVTFVFDNDLPEDGVEVQFNLQITLDMNYGGLLDLYVEALPWLDQFQYYAMETDEYKFFTAYPDGQEGLCWSNKSDSEICPFPVGACPVRYDYKKKASSVIMAMLGISEVRAEENCFVPDGSQEASDMGDGRRTPPDGWDDELGTPPGDDNPPSDPDAPVDLVYDVDYYGMDGNKISTSREVFPGMQIDVKARVQANEGDAGNWNPDGSEYIQICYYVELDDGEWEEWARGTISIAKLDEGRDNLSETKRYTIPSGYETADFRVEIDCTDKVVETDEHNTSEEKRYRISHLLPDYAVIDVFFSDPATGARYYNGATLLEDKEWYPYCHIASIGEANAPINVEVSHRMDGEERDTDTLGTEDISLGSSTTETVWSKWKLGDTGNRTYTCCVDSKNQLPELDEGNNCKSATFQVVPHKSDIIVSDLFLITEGGQTVRNGTSIPEDSTVKPYCVAQNIGNRNMKNGIRLSYEVNAGTHRGDDGLDAEDLKVGAMKTEYMSDGFRLGDTGTRTYRCVADYQRNENELNENNNSKTMSFTVYPTNPKITITDIYVTYDGKVVRDGGRGKRGKRYHPNVRFKNTGNKAMSCEAEAKYYINADKYRDRDGIDRLGVNQSGYEYVSNDNIKLGDKGWRTYRVVIRSNCGEFPTVEKIIRFEVR
jgi:hypothetical protein